MKFLNIELKYILLTFTILLIHSCSWRNEIWIVNLTNEVVEVTFHLSVDSSKEQIFKLPENDEWKIYSSTMRKGQAQIDYNRGRVWEFEYDENNIVVGSLKPNQALLLGDVSGGAIINDSDIVGEFNINYLKLSSQTDSVVFVNDYVRKSFLFFDADHDFRIQISG